MAKNNNLGDFLKDLADTIRAKKGTTGTINPQNFSSEIESIQTGTDTSDATATASDLLSGKTAYSSSGKITGTLQKQTKSVQIVTNKQTIISPDAGKLLEKVVVTTNVQPVTQEKTVTITENGTTEITPDSGKVLSKVTATVNVPSSGAELNIAYGDTPPTDTSKLWIKSSEPSEITFGQRPTFIMDTQITPLYTFSKLVNEHIMAPVGDYVYFFGGKASPSGYYEPSNQILKYNVKTNALTTLSVTLPIAVYGNAGVAVVGTKIYIFGGNQTRKPSSSVTYSSSSAIQIFDTTTDTVRQSSTNLPNSIYLTRTVVVDTNIYLVGYAGYTNTLGKTIESNSIFLFDTIIESITTLSFLAPSRTSGTAVVGSKIYFFGGYNSTTSQYEKKVDVLDLDTGTATTLSGVEAPFEGIRPVCIAIGTMIYIFGGSQAILNNVYSFDTLTNEFVKTAIAGNYPMSGMKTNDIIYLYVSGTSSTLNKITANRQLTSNDIFVQQSYLTNLFDLMSSPTRVEIGIDKVYKGNASGNAELCDAYLHDGTNWVNVNTGENYVEPVPTKSVTINVTNYSNAGDTIIINGGEPINVSTLYYADKTFNDVTSLIVNKQSGDICYYIINGKQKDFTNYLGDNDLTDELQTGSNTLELYFDD